MPRPNKDLCKQPASVPLFLGRIYIMYKHGKKKWMWQNVNNQLCPSPILLGRYY